MKRISCIIYINRLHKEGKGMWKMGVKIATVFVVLVIIAFFGINKYITSTTIFQYGIIPNDTIPEKFEEVTYTIPTIDEEGNRGTQTFTMEHEMDNGHIVKLFIRNDKVKKQEIIAEEDIPKKVRGNLPTSNY